jgi:acetolactate synthase small subunit
MPVGDGRLNRIWLAVDEDARIEQVIRQVEKLEDVLSVRSRSVRAGRGFFHVNSEGVFKIG